MNQTTKELLNLIHKSTSPYHTVAASRDLLLANGFAELSLAEDWTLARTASILSPASIRPCLPSALARQAPGD